MNRLLFLIFIWLGTFSSQAKESSLFKIKVIDEDTQRGVPLVELETVNNIQYITDSNGLVAFQEPGLMDRDVFFFVRSHGYEFQKDGFGYNGTILHIKEGGAAEIKLKRINIAERLYRITGAGIYRDTILLNEKAPIQEPVLNARVLGQDSAMAAIYSGKIYWFWGDTKWEKYPLGNFHTSGAISELPEKGGLDPSHGINLKYFKNEEGFSKGMCPMEGNYPVWIQGLLTVPDEKGKERLVCHYSHIETLEKIHDHGLLIFNDKTQLFEKITALDFSNRWQHPQGQPVRITQNGKDYFYFPTSSYVMSPFLTVRVQADLKCIQDPTRYEAFTCLVPGTHYSGKETQVERSAKGELIYAWKANTDPVRQNEENELLSCGKIKASEERYQVKDIETGKPIKLHAGSVAWNDFRKRWILIASESGGSSFLGEVWFSESEHETGPWRWVKKIVTHDHYTFYNPIHHPFFDQEGGRFIYFEGTYANTFSGNSVQTPRYDYNQIMYRLDLSDPRLKLK
jgi:hypothetical protein